MLTDAQRDYRRRVWRDRDCRAASEVRARALRSDTICHASRLAARPILAQWVVALAAYGRGKGSCMLAADGPT